MASRRRSVGVLLRVLPSPPSAQQDSSIGMSLYLSFRDDLAAFLASNEAPPDILEENLRLQLLDARNSLNGVNDQISRTRVALADLLDKRDTLNDSIFRYKAILAAHKRLPFEMLEEIFSYCVTEPTAFPPKKRDCPWVLTRVCSRWRAIVLQCPRLWNNVFIDFDTHPLSRHVRLARLAKTYLSFGSAISLYIHVNPYQFLDAELRDLIPNLITSNATRLKNLVLERPEKIPSFFFLPPANFRNLESLTVLFSQGFAISQLVHKGTPSNKNGTTVFNWTPKLRTVTINACGVDLRLRTFRLPWGQLTELNLLDAVVPFVTGHQLLKTCVNLVVCRMCIPPNPRSLQRHLGMIVLQHLRDFQIIAQRKGNYGQFLTHLVMPCLRRFEIISRDDAKWASQRVAAVMLYSKCSLESLTCVNISVPYIIPILYVQPQIQELALLGVPINYPVLDVFIRVRVATKLESLVITASNFDFVIHMLCRHWTGLSASLDNRKTLKSVTIVYTDGCRKTEKGWRAMEFLRREGLKVTVKNQAGEVLNTFDEWPNESPSS